MGKIFEKIFKKLDGEAKTTKQHVTLEIVSTFEEEEFSTFSDFEDFFAEVDVNNAYEEDWPEWLENGVKGTYEEVWNELRSELKIKATNK